MVPAARVTPQMLDKRSVVILNDTIVPPGLAGGALKRYVERGGGLLVAFGDRSDVARDRNRSAARQARCRRRSHRRTRRDDRLPRLQPSGLRGLQGAAQRRLLRRARPALPRAGARPRPTACSRGTTTAAMAAAEKRVGAGRVIAWTTTLDDSWTDLALKPVYLPLVHQFTRYLVAVRADVVTGRPSARSSTWPRRYKAKADRVVVTPAGERLRMAAAMPGMLELNEHGVYEIRSASNGSGRPDRIAVNLDPAESDLTPLDPSELVAAVTGRAAAAVASCRETPPRSRRRKPSVGRASGGICSSRA